MTSTIDVCAGSPVETSTRLPQSEAMVRDLLLIRTELDSHGIPYLLIRNADDRPALAVDVRHRQRVAEALTAASLTAPLRARIKDPALRRSVNLGNGLLSVCSDPRMVRVYRQQQGEGRGDGIEVELQFWLFEDERAICPTENSITRKVLPHNEMTRTTVELYGRVWPTIEGMFAPHVADVMFDIDIVLSWVDGNDPEFRARREAHMTGRVVGAGDDADARIRQIDELRYALRSVHAFAPWVRRIFIATDSVVPVWLKPHPKITIIRAEDHFTDTSALPTYNSHAVESQLQHIPGISEHFLYANDDMFLGRPVTSAMFFSPGGVTKFIEADERIGLGGNTIGRSGHDNAARVNRQVLWERFGHLITRHLAHTAVPLRRSVLLELEREFPEHFARTRASKFRSSTDISVTNSLYHYYALLTGRAVQQEAAKASYLDTTTRAGLARLPELLRTRRYDFFCLNDSSFPEVGAAERARLVGDFLRSYFPVPAPWEREAVSG
ncbi:stealth family protein [Actinocrispum wychmicini]|uniref:Stealth-like protein n=1 Tax=Actinocrispum wychmicini TaxID=1213861 RepID=A0A4R2JAW5_9PSEU|nr:stealth family protein [Actinocrispum wychmicini]TCO55934.1 Stealth-like protein [Actinocrispum wychmicini]